MDELELAKEHMEHAAHGGGHEEAVPHGRRAAVAIAALAAALAICEFQAKDAQVASLTRFISASDTWSQYQAKSIRRGTFIQSAEVLESLPNAADAAVAAKAASARANADRMASEPGADGMEQLAGRAHELEHERDHEAHRQHGLELASSGLQLAIVIASVSVVTRIGALLLAAGVLGAVAAVYAVAAATSLV